MRTNDAAKPSWSTVHQEEGEECLFATQPWDHQRAEKGEETGTRNLERADYHAHFADAVSPFHSFKTLTCAMIIQTFCSRPRTQDFIAQQLQIMTAMQAEQEKQAREAEERKVKRQQQMHQREHIPPVPELPR